MKILYRNLAGLLLLIGIVCSGCTQVDDIEMISGFKNFESRQFFQAMNRLQALADYDNIKVPDAWPVGTSSGIGGDGHYPYVYQVKNEGNTLDYIEFYFPLYSDECHLDDTYYEFCFQNLYGRHIKFRYDGKFLVELTSDIVNSPDESETYELVVKNNDKYFPEVKTIDSKVVLRDYQSDCELDKDTNAKSCKTEDGKTKKLLYTEKVILNNPKKNADSDGNAYKYVKYDSDNRIVAEYFYQTHKYLSYDKDGNIIGMWQDYTKEKNNHQIREFKFYDKRVSDIYIDFYQKNDINWNPLEEVYYDREKNPIRRYIAEYKDEEIAKIHVFDFVNKKDWEVVPAPEESPF